MDTLNLIDPQRSAIKYQKIIFPDGQPHIKLETSTLAVAGSTIRILSRISNPTDLLLILFAKDALEYAGFKNIQLAITYLMAARMDRVMTAGEPLSLKVVARIINQAGFEKVCIFDPHSEVSTALIDRSFAVTNHAYVKEAIGDALKSPSTHAYWIVSPDAGALKKIHKVAEFLGTSQVAECMKTRDVKTGALSGFKSMQEDYKGLPCFIIDDICDGGGTFSGLAKVLKEHNAGEIILVVSHGIFSKGYQVEGIDKIYTTNSFKNIDDPGVHVFNIEKYM